MTSILGLTGVGRPILGFRTAKDFKLPPSIFSSSLRVNTFFISLPPCFIIFSLQGKYTSSEIEKNQIVINSLYSVINSIYFPVTTKYYPFDTKKDHF